MSTGMGIFGSMFAHPAWLLALTVPIICAVVYVMFTRKRRQRSLQFGNFTVLAEVTAGTKPWLKHVQAIATLLALVCVVISLAGPLGETKVARNRATVMLVVDVSLSMSAKDVDPDRISAAKQAGAEFIESLPDNLNVGLVTFAGRAQTPVSPTTDHDTARRALESAELDSATATGDAIAAATQAIEQFSKSIQGATEGPPPATIVLLSDGKQTIPESLTDPRGAYTAAEEAAKSGIPVNTISFGTKDGLIYADGDPIPVPTDNDSLMEIARRTDGKFFGAESLDQLRDVYSELTDDIGYELKTAENPRPWLIAACGLLTAAAISTVWASRRIPS